MKLKNLKKGVAGKKQTKKDQQKVQVENTNDFDQEEQNRDDALVDLKDDLNKKEQPKRKINQGIQSNLLQETQIDVSNIIIQKKQDEKKPISGWVVDQKDVASLLQKDFKLQDVDHEFQSLTDVKLNAELKQKKQKKKAEQTVETVGNMKYAPMSLGTNPFQSKNTQKIVFGKPQVQTSPIGFAVSSGPAMNFTNSKLKETVQVATIEKSAQQLRQQQMQRKMSEKQEQVRAKISADINPVAPKNAWGFKKATVVQQKPIQFKTSALNFTNSNISSNDNSGFKGFQPLQKSVQQQKFERKEPELKITSKKEQQERRRKREEEEKLGMGKPKVQKV